nr:hypothetical protein [Tanacetum cinerariifolium]
MASSHQQALVDASSENRPPILEKGSYVSWTRRFMRHVDGKRDQGIRIRCLIEKRSEADIDAMNWILLGIPNDIYNSVDSCSTAQQMWKRVQRLMQRTELSKQKRQSRLMNEFDEFSTKAGESLESAYNQFCTLINYMDRNIIKQEKIVINTKFLNSLKLEWSKYVTRARQQHKLGDVKYDELFDFLTQNEPDVKPSRAKQAARNHDPLALGKIIAVKPEDTLLTTMMLLACAITQHFLTPTNNRLRTSSNIRNHAYVQDGRVEIQGKNSRYVGVNRRNIRNQERNYVNQGIVAGNNIVQTTDGDIEIMQRNLQTTANNSAMDDDQLEELNTLVIMMARLQPEDNESNVEPKYDLILSASKKACVLELKRRHLKIIVLTSIISEGDEDRGMDNNDVQNKKADKTEVPVTRFSRSSDLASKFLNFSDISPADTEIISLLDVHVHHEVPRIHTSTLLFVQSTPTPLPTTKTTNIPSSILDFASVFRFNDKVIALEKDVAELKNDPLHTQVTALVDVHLDTRIGATREEFINFLSASLTNRITEQVRNQLPQILPKEVSNFAPPVIEKMIQDRDEKDKDEGPSAGSDRGLKKRKTSKDAEPTISLKTKDSSSRSSKGTKSQPKYSRKSVHAEEPEFKVGDTDTPQGQEGNQGKTPQKGPTQNWLKTLTASTSTCKSLKKLDKLMSTPIDFSSYILNGLKTKNMTLEILLGPAFRLLKGTRSNYAELEYNFKECYKALSEKLDWENPEGGDYLFDLSKTPSFDHV